MAKENVEQLHVEDIVYADTNRHKGQAFEEYVAAYYVSKIQQCKARNIQFKLSLTQVRNMLRAKKCQLTGELLTHTGAGKKTSIQRPTDVTIDRLDSSKPYVSGNVCAASKRANSAKNAFESVYGGESLKVIHTMSKVLKGKVKP